MKRKIILAAMLIIFNSVYAQQIDVRTGDAFRLPENAAITGLMTGDQNYFYGVVSNAANTMLHLEKYDRKSLLPVYSKEIKNEKNFIRTEKVYFSHDKIYVFNRCFDKVKNRIQLNCQVLSADGESTGESTTLLDQKVVADQPAQFDIIKNNSDTKFLIRASYTPSPDSGYFTVFSILRIKDMVSTASRTIPGGLFSNESVYSTSVNRLLGMYLDDNDNIVYAFIPEGNQSEIKIGVLPSGALSAAGISGTPLLKTLDFDLGMPCVLSDLKFSESKNFLFAQGFFTSNIPGKEETGIVSLSLDMATFFDFENIRLATQHVIRFEQKLHQNLNQAGDGPFQYKIDYAFAIGEEMIVTGQQFKITDSPAFNSDEEKLAPKVYEFRNIIIAKLDRKSGMQWINIMPMRIRFSAAHPESLAPYYAGSVYNKIRIILTSPENLLKQGDSKLEFATLGLETGEVKNSSMASEFFKSFKTDDSVPGSPPARKADLYLNVYKNEIIILRHEWGKGRFLSVTVTQ